LFNLLNILWFIYTDDFLKTAITITAVSCALFSFFVVSTEAFFLYAIVLAVFVMLNALLHYCIMGSNHLFSKEQCMRSLLAYRCKEICRLPTKSRNLILMRSCISQTLKQWHLARILIIEILSLLQTKILRRVQCRPFRLMSED
jgi:hypothetical protein